MLYKWLCYLSSKRNILNDHLKFRLFEDEANYIIHFSGTHGMKDCRSLGKSDDDGLRHTQVCDPLRWTEKPFDQNYLGYTQLPEIHSF